MEHRKNLIVDVIALLVYTAVANPALTGVGVHEWLGLGVLVAFLVHVALHWDWCADAARTAIKDSSRTRTGNLVLGILLLIALMACAVSGLMVSGAVLPVLGFYAEGYYFWDPLHAASAKLLLALLLVHVVVHWRWIVSFFKRNGAEHGNRNE